MVRKDDEQNQLHDDIQVHRTQVDGEWLTADEILAKLNLDIRQIKREKDLVKINNQEKTPKQSVPTQKQTRKKRRKKPKQSKQATTISDDQLMHKVVEEQLDSVTTTTEDQAQADNRTLMKGSIWLSIGNIVSRLLGAAFILPWLLMLGHNANRSNALFSQGYTIYGILLAIATFGFPSAISKVVAQLVAKKDWVETRNLTKQALYVGTILGLIFGSLLYLAAPVLSNNNPNMIPVLHSLAPAVLVFPLMSMMRGVFQGHQLMHISAISDIVEQVARIVYLLVMTIVVLQQDPTNWVGAVVQATFAAFVGAIFSMLVLLFGWVRCHDTIMPAATGLSQITQTTSKVNKMVGNILRESWPFVVIGSATNLFLFVDQYTFFNIMNHFFEVSSDQLQIDFSLFSANPNKLIMIVISFAISIATTALPLLSGSKEALSETVIQRQLTQILRLTILILLPSALGMFAVADPLYKMFYTIDSTNQAGIYLLQFSTMLAIVFSFFMLLALVLQALSDTKIMMTAFVWGLVIKLLLQVPLVYFLQGMGALIASAIGMGFSVTYMLAFMKRRYQVSLVNVSRDLGQSFVASAVMAVITYLVVTGLQHFVFPVDTKITVSIETLIGVMVGGVVLVLAYGHLGLLGDVLGSRVARLPKFLRPKAR